MAMETHQSAGRSLHLLIETFPFLRFFSSRSESKLAFLPPLIGLVVFNESYFPSHNLCTSERVNVRVTEAGWSRRFIARECLMFLSNKVAN